MNQDYSVGDPHSTYLLHIPAGRMVKKKKKKEEEMYPSADSYFLFAMMNYNDDIA